MRLADVVLRRGHLSEDALVEIWTLGHHPAHLDECPSCASRAIEMSRWLEDVQAIGRADADAVFSDHHLADQQSAIMRRLTQLDRPSKVISFPAAPPGAREAAPRRVHAGWVAATAAAAGLMIGIVGMELSHLIPGNAAPVSVATTPQAPAGAAAGTDGLDLIEGAFDRPSLGDLHTLDELTPRVADVILASNR